MQQQIVQLMITSLQTLRFKFGSVHTPSRPGLAPLVRHQDTEDFNFALHKVQETDNEMHLQQRLTDTGSDDASKMCCFILSA